MSGWPRLKLRPAALPHNCDAFRLLLAYGRGLRNPTTCELMAGKAKKPNPAKKMITLFHGGKRLDVPELSARVGPSSPELLRLYPKLNEAADIAVVEHYLSQLKELKDSPVRESSCDATGKRVVSAVKSQMSWSDRDAAVAAFQKVFGVTDPLETRHGMIKPAGDTLRMLVDIGAVADSLLTQLECQPLNAIDYVYREPFDREKFRAEYAKQFASVPKYSPASVPDLLMFLGFMERDLTVLDIRWMAYMLGTAFVESSRVVTVNDPTRKKPKKVWSNFTPGEETGHGKGLDYYLPVKVTRLSPSSASIMEQDG
ncbi:MAG: hypothetical protein RL701_7990, partial [Pseudomonadota bacterium]